MLFSKLMIKKSQIMLKKRTYNSQYIAYYAQVKLTVMLTETDRDINRVQPFQFYHVLGFKVSTSWDWSTLSQYVVLWRKSFTHVKQLLVIVCPKILKIMPVDAYNASIILTCFTYLLCSELCWGQYNLPTPTCGLFLIALSVS